MRQEGSWRPRTLFDFGSGAATGYWAATEVFGKFNEVSSNPDFFSFLLFLQCYGSGMSILDPGSEFFPSWIRIIELEYFNPKKWFLNSRKYDLGCSSRIPDPEVKTAPDPGGIVDPGSRIRIRNTVFLTYVQILVVYWCGVTQIGGFLK
jgi:hypothetical protein